MTITTAVAKRIDEYLFSRGITLYKLAKDACIPVASLQNLYRGTTKTPTLALLCKLCVGLGVSLPEFFDSPLFTSAELELD